MSFLRRAKNDWLAAGTNCRKCRIFLYTFKLSWGSHVQNSVTGISEAVCVIVTHVIAVQEASSRDAADWNKNCLGVAAGRLTEEVFPDSGDDRVTSTGSVGQPITGAQSFPYLWGVKIHRLGVSAARKVDIRPRDSCPGRRYP